MRLRTLTKSCRHALPVVDLSEDQWVIATPLPGFYGLGRIACTILSTLEIQAKVSL